MARPMKVKITWDEALAGEAADEGADEGLVQAARVVLQAANQVVPYDTGALAGTGIFDYDPKEQVASVYYDSVYAGRLHQNPSFRFKNGRRGKWLSYTFGQSRTHVLQYFGDAMRVAFSRRRRPPR